MSTRSEQPRRLRGDAQRNRDRLLAAARELFAERGIDVAMADIARHAGVSNGTLYNRFPSREDLIEAVFTDRLETMAALAARALADDDPWRGFAGYLTAVCELQAADRGFNEVAARGLPLSPAAQRFQEEGQADGRGGRPNVGSGKPGCGPDQAPTAGPPGRRGPRRTHDAGPRSLYHPGRDRHDSQRLPARCHDPPSTLLPLHPSVGQAAMTTRR